MKIDFEKMGGLVPTIVQDAETKRVLMLGYMNEEAYQKTLYDGLVTFWSRSKERLWQKGEISGNRLELVEMKADCDEDALLVLVKPKGPTCHTGEKSCFGLEGFCLIDLFKLLKRRKVEMPKDSYTAELLKGGLEKITGKVEEESEEVVRAAKTEGKQRLIEESCDLIYHLFVLLVDKDVDLGDLEKELCARCIER